MGECLLALAGPFLFQRFGLNIPEAATVGCVLGACLGFAAARGILRMLNTGFAPASVMEITKPETRTGLADVNLAGVSGSFPADPAQKGIQAALARFSDRDFDKIRVEVREGKVVLKGKVHSWIDEAEAERIAFDMPGIQEVDNRLQVVP